MPVHFTVITALRRERGRGKGGGRREIEGARYRELWKEKERRREKDIIR